MDNAPVEVVMLCAWGMFFWHLCNFAEKHWGDGTLGGLLAFFGPALLAVILIALPESVRSNLSWLPNVLFVFANIYLFFSIASIIENRLLRSQRKPFVDNSDKWASQDFGEIDSPPRRIQSRGAIRLANSNVAEPSTADKSDKRASKGSKDRAHATQCVQHKRAIHLNTTNAIELNTFIDLATKIGIECEGVEFHIRSLDKPTRRTYIEALRDALRQYKPFPFWMPTEGNLNIARLFPRVGEESDRHWCVFMLSREKATSEDNVLAYRLASEAFDEAPYAWGDQKAEMEFHGRGTTKDINTAADTAFEGVQACEIEDIPYTRCSVILADIAWQLASDEDDRSDALNYLYNYCKHNPSDADSWIKLFQMLLACSRIELSSWKVIQWNYAIHYLLYACEDQSRNYVEEEPLESIFDSLVAIVKPDNFSLCDYFEFMSVDEGTQELYQENVNFLLSHGFQPRRTVLSTVAMDRILAQPLWGELTSILQQHGAKNVILFK
ncbi:hypothetical protein KUV95_12500 [Microbulbifer agarilyticus]|uniref:hypothetical protein n=1 Tax=Microbulbifer agarilyticus TaxID=260552 RepID=UPI001C96F40A|nr:hypothetical protein [Microbulbifer agarilyticus]MBY6212371.1 hypothetical protein [Microbulbifer agarilyticus]